MIADEGNACDIRESDNAPRASVPGPAWGQTCQRLCRRIRSVVSRRPYDADGSDPACRVADLRRTRCRAGMRGSGFNRQQVDPMRNRAFAAITLVIAALVALWFMVDREPKTGGPQASGGRQLRAEALPETGSPMQRAGAESRIAPIRSTAFVDADGPRTGPAAGEPLRVLVLDGATGIPVPSAEVAWTDESRTPPLRCVFFGAPSTLVSDFDHCPQRTVADAR